MSGTTQDRSCEDGIEFCSITIILRCESESSCWLEGRYIEVLRSGKRRELLMYDRMAVVEFETP